MTSSVREALLLVTVSYCLNCFTQLLLKHLPNSVGVLELGCSQYSSRRDYPIHNNNNNNNRWREMSSRCQMSCIRGFDDAKRDYQRQMEGERMFESPTHLPVLELELVYKTNAPFGCLCYGKMGRRIQI